MQYSYEIPLMISVTPLMISKIIAINIVKLFFPLSDVCSNPASKLAQNVSDKAWLLEHDINMENGKRCYLIMQPAYAFKALPVVDYMQLKSFAEDANFIPLPSFEDAEENHYSRKMFQQLL